jgi:hypothetical protein
MQTMVRQLPYVGANGTMRVLVITPADGGIVAGWRALLPAR